MSSNVSLVQSQPYLVISNSVAPTPNLGGRVVEALRSDELTPNSADQRIVETTSPYAGPVDGQSYYPALSVGPRLVINDDLDPELNSFSLEKESAPPSLPSTSAMSPFVVVPSRVQTPTSFDSSSSASSSFFSVSPFSEESTPPAESPVRRDQAYCVEFATRLLESYDGLEDFPEESKADLELRFESLTKDASKSPAQKIMDKAIFSFIYEIIELSQNPPQFRLLASEGGLVPLYPKLPIGLDDLIERLTPFFLEFKAKINPPLLYPLSAEAEYRRVCDQLGAPNLFLSAEAEYLRSCGHVCHINKASQAEYDRLFSLANIPRSLLPLKAPLPVIDPKKLIKIIDEIERRGQVPAPNGTPSTIPSFDKVYEELLLLRNECQIIAQAGEAELEEFDLECTSAIAPGSKESMELVAEIEGSIFQQLLLEMVQELNGIDGARNNQQP